MEKKIRWGILGTGSIARQLTSELKHSQNAVVQAVGSRTLESATNFAKEFTIPDVHGSYEELTKNPEVDIVYIATPHPLHRENALMSLNAGKAVLCEKSFTVNAREAKEIIELAREKKLFLMEAMWTRYLPTIQKVRSWIEEGAIGEVKMLKADLGFKFNRDPEHRLLKKELGGGALLDVGIYTTSFASWLFGTQPNRVESAAYIGNTGVDEWFTALFDYGEGRSATIHNAVQLPLGNQAHIIGTKGRIYLPHFHDAKTATLMRDNHPEEVYTDSSERGLLHEAEEAMRCLREGLLESPLMPLDETLAIMETMDLMRKQWGLTYSADEELS